MFFNYEDCCIPQKDILHAYKMKRIHMVHIRFQFDKSATNFSIRNFTATEDPILNPVAVAVSIIHRMQMLGVPTSEALGVCSAGRSKEYFGKPWCTSFDRLVLRVDCRVKIESILQRK
jgi:hypothetical protein